MKLVWAVIRENRLREVQKALQKEGFTGATVVHVSGMGEEDSHPPLTLFPHIKMEIITSDNLAEKAVETIMNAAWTGLPGDGGIAILPVEKVWKIRHKERLITLLEKVIDPVCKMKIEKMKAAGKTEFAGTSYYFCSEICLLKFQESPEKFLRASKSSKVKEE